MVSTIMEGIIDGLEKKREDIQGKIVQVKDLLGQLQDNMKKKDEKDTGIIRQLKGKSTFVTDSLAVAKFVAENTDGQGYMGFSEVVHCQEDTHPKRLELPVFSGDNPCEGLHRAEQYFHFTGIGDKDNLKATMCLDGRISNLQRSLVEFESLFEDPTGLPQSISTNHTLLLKERSQPPNIFHIVILITRKKRLSILSRK
ncbi:hypothetical protein V6N11_012051 [Hibiscus sabdariffa]|uniref:Uncharacterized protein n=1 Tax=Hibiscus sabdariffa TaxID=183260 RepID=A0ABR2A2M5_9ROSI